MTVIHATSGDRSLFHIAARMFGDPLAANRLAQMSGKSDPWIYSPTDVTLPTVAGPDTGGLPAPGTTV